MPVKKDASKRWVEVETLVPGTPEEVWRAIATGPGMTAWFTPAKVEEKVGGAILFSFGPGMESKGVVMGWEPPFRFAYEEREWKEGAPVCATEVTVEAVSGGRCVVRMTHTLATTQQDWDNDLESFEGGWPGFFEVLRLYLGNFSGRNAASARTMAMCQVPRAQAWKQLCESLGLAGADYGDERAAPKGSLSLAGVVERVHQDSKSSDIMVRMERPGPAVAWFGAFEWQGQASVAAVFYFYGDDAAARAGRCEKELAEWSARVFGAPQG